MHRGRTGRLLLRSCAAALTVLTSIALIVGVLIYVVASSGMGTERLSIEAEAAIRSFSGMDVDATLGPASVSLDRSEFLAVRVPDVSLKSGTDGAPLMEAGAIDFGVRALPLIGGDIELRSARVTDARIFAGAFAAGPSPDWMAAVRNADGLVDPDLVAPALFGAVHQLFDAVGTGSARSIELDDVDLMLAPGGPIAMVRIDSAQLSQVAAGELRFSARLEVDGRAVAVDGSARRDAASKLITALALNVDAEGADAADASDVATLADTTNAPRSTDAQAAVGDMLGPVSVEVSGEEQAAGASSRLTLTGSIGTSTYALDKKGNYLEGEVGIDASISTGENKVRIERLEIIQGHSRYTLYGPLGPRPVAEGQPAAYRFELASDNSISAPTGSTEPAMEFKAMVSGTYDPAAQRLEVPSLDIRTSSGAITAKGVVDFVAGKPPGVDLSVTVPELSVSHVKQLWPFTAASNARRWAMANLFGGRMVNGQVRYRVPPGRIGNGAPLTADEVSGHVEISGARFDITGGVPPMRDAVAAVDFRGNDVDVALASGAVFLPEGGAVTASNGKFAVRDAYKDVVVGQLELDLSGGASSVARLASYEPIDGLRSTGMTPDEFSGNVSGHVSTQVPLIGGLEMKDLSWKVSLDYTDLALARPIEQQMVSNATGTITIDPEKAVIEAKALLSGAPAEISIVKPLREGGPKASSELSLVLDDKAREKLAPGMGELVQGPVKVSFASGEGADRKVTADLTDARLDLPWVGWSKGPGVSADVAFTMVSGGERTRLDDFKLTGKSFAIGGDIVLGNGGLASAKLGLVQLNRGDDAKVSIQRDGKGYDVRIDGDALDARALIKLLKAEEDQGGDDDGSKRTVSVEAKIARLTGFHDESLSDVTISYSSRGGTLGSALVSGTTSSGAAFSMQDRTEDGMRALEMKSADAGALLRFLDVYEHMLGGSIRFALSGPANGTLSGQVDAVNFQVIDERKLQSLVSTAPEGSDRSLNQAVRRDIDTSRVTFERGYALISRSDNGIALSNGILRGPTIGSTFQGTLRDKAGNMDMTGTFMPAYGLNRIFGELPLVGAILGNGRDRGLIGVTFRLSGDADEPTLTVNPLSAIAPGIFRSIFEFR